VRQISVHVVEVQQPGVETVATGPVSGPPGQRFPRFHLVSSPDGETWCSQSKFWLQAQISADLAATAGVMRPSTMTTAVPQSRWKVTAGSSRMASRTVGPADTKEQPV